jgi:hypothetical protein
MNIPLLLRTLAPLRWEQLLWRPVRLVEKQLYRRVPQLTRRWREPGPPVPPPTDSTIEYFRQVILKDFIHLFRSEEEERSELARLGAGVFSFLNRSIELGLPDWNRRHGSHLWNFQLHYFPFVPGLARLCRDTGKPGDFLPVQELIEDWIEKATPGRSDGWDAYPVSLRTVNWIYGYALLADLHPEGRFLERWRSSIERQMDYLSSHLERHLLANHLFKNIKALVIGGLFFNRPDWLATGERLLQREVDEQILADGGHFERAPMYHAQTLADLVECSTLLRHSGRPVPARFDEVIGLMAEFLDALTDREGRLTLFNDSANTPELRPKSIIATARRLTKCPIGPPRKNFPVTGYFLWQAEDGDEKIVVDAGPPSVAYNTAHAHCDLLSFELRLDGQPWIVDTGVHGYGGDPYRHYCRSTRAHNTVMIDGQEQSEIWSTFRMGRQARLLDAASSESATGWSFLGRANHYARPDLEHKRRIHRDHLGNWTIEDQITGGTFKYAECFLHLHPDLDVVAQSDGSYLVGRERLFRRLVPTGRLRTELIEAQDSGSDGWYFPEFGLARPGIMIIGRLYGPANDPFGFRILSGVGQ